MGSSSTEAFPAMQEVLLEFRAGKMKFEGKKVVPDARKGLVRIARGDERLIHFQWLDRTQNVVEDVSKLQCFVFLLYITNSHSLSFLWLLFGIRSNLDIVKIQVLKLGAVSLPRWGKKGEKSLILS
ncbi:hypothetical protein Pint_13908 [Pistacia integerrima]|uniref:Uncharacterized protein n=1 Tax=Pistacia integerrima TaxID=434235 RepID=A0ACC0YAM6_9ROSI|nr:hypothetical protein Pint_13908 [Pistacia integerrima]